MNLRHLRYFTTAARLGSLTAAARALNVSQPALGYQLRDLEAALGVTLLHRHSRGVRLTEAGEALFESGTAALDAFGAAERSVSSFRQLKSQRLLFGVAPTPGRALLPDMLSLLASSASNLQIVVRHGLSDELVAAILAGDLDAAICYDAPASTPAIEVTTLYSENLYLVGTPGSLMSAPDPVPFSFLSGIPLVLDGKPRPFRRAIDMVLNTLKIQLDLLEIEPVNVKREIITHHGRSTIVPRGLFQDELRSGRFTARRIVDPSIESTVSLVIHRRLADEAIDVLQTILPTLVDRLVAQGALDRSGNGRG